MFYRYGSFEFEDGECDLLRTNVIMQPSPRGNRMVREVTHYIRALVIEDTLELLSARIAAIQSAFDLDYQNAGLYIDSNTPSQHLLLNDDPLNISGTKVIQRSFPEGGGDEYSTARTFQATIQAVYDDAIDGLVEYQESLQFVGTGGPVWEYDNGFFEPIYSLIADSSTQTIIQKGRAVGYGAYLLPPGPKYPAFEHQDRRVELYETPTFMGRQYRLYPSSWMYVHSVPQRKSGYPNPTIG